MGFDTPAAYGRVSFIAFLKGFLEPITFPLAVYHMHFVGNSIKKRGGYVAIAKYLFPISKSYSSNHHRFSFVVLDPNLGNKLRSFFGERNIIQFLNNELSITGVTLLSKRAKSLSSRVSISSLARPHPVTKRILIPCLQSFMPSRVAMWVLPVPLLPIKLY
jgi:hypothetical protein